MNTSSVKPDPALSTPPPKRDGIIGSTFRAFQYRNFRLMWGGAFTSTTGTFVQEVAQGWLVYTLTDSAFLLGLTAFLNGAPILLFSLLGGVAADRMDRRKLLIASQCVQMMSALALATLIWMDLIVIWHIMIAAFVNGVGQAFGGPAYQALIPSLVEQEDLPNAIALLSIQFNLARVVGPVIGVFAYEQLGAGACFGINGLSFLVVIFAILTLPVRFVPKKTKVHVLHSLKEGLTFVYRSHALSALVFLAMFSAFLGVPLVTLLPVFAKEIYQSGPESYGTLLALSGAGAVVGALFVAWMGNIPHKAKASLLMQVGLGVTMLMFAMSTRLWVGCLFVFLAGWSILSVFALVNSLVQMQAHEEMRGRIMSVYNTVFRGAMPLGNLAAGSVASHIGAPLAIAVNGALLGIVALLMLRDKRVVRL